MTEAPTSFGLREWPSRSIPDTLNDWFSHLSAPVYTSLTALAIWWYRRRHRFRACLLQTSQIVVLCICGRLNRSRNLDLAHCRIAVLEANIRTFSEWMEKIDEIPEASVHTFGQRLHHTLSERRLREIDQSLKAAYYHPQFSPYAGKKIVGSLERTLLLGEIETGKSLRIAQFLKDHRLDLKTELSERTTYLQKGGCNGETGWNGRRARNQRIYFILVSSLALLLTTRGMRWRRRLPPRRVLPPRIHVWGRF